MRPGLVALFCYVKTGLTLENHSKFLKIYMSRSALQENKVCAKKYSDNQVIITLLSVR